MRVFGLFLVVLFGGVFVWATGDLPVPGDPASPAATHPNVSVHYIERAYTDTNTPNMVTAVLADYRGFDTFGEAVVVVAAALSCLLILLRRNDGNTASPEEPPVAGASPDPDGSGKSEVGGAS
jgi:multicomponent Na+:H+ antiporter subunit B